MNGPDDQSAGWLRGDASVPRSDDDAIVRDQFAQWPDGVPVAEPLEQQRGRRPWPAFVLTVLVIAGVVAGVVVATRPSGPSPATRVRAAAAKTVGARSAQFKLTIDVSVGGANQTTITTTGSSDFAAKATQMQFSADGVSETILSVNGDGYLQLPPDLVRLPAGARWIAITPADVGGSASLGNIGSSDPTQGLEFLGALVGSPVVVDHEQLDNVPVTHYKIVADLQSLFAKVGSVESNVLPVFAKGYQAVASSNDLAHFPLDVWLDSQGRVRRFDQTLNANISGTRLTEVESMTFSNFGVPVTVSAPDPSQTVPFAQVKAQISALTSGQASS
jgi:hypothetical protein